MKSILGVVLALVALPGASAMALDIDPAVKPYAPVSGVAGNLNSIGSDTLNNLMTMWAEGFRRVYPNVNIQVEGKGSATAPPALTSGTAQLGPMSRAMKPEELDAFEKKHGYKPTQISVALDCLAVYVHKDNPIHGLTFDQIDSVFSRTKARGFGDVATWGQLGLTGDWAEQPIRMYGRNSASGTYLYFKEHALKKGDYKDTVKEMPGSAAVVEAVANDRQGIGYSGIGYKTSGVRAIPLAESSKGKLAEPTFENALSGKYPLGRTLYIYVNKKPNEPLPTLVSEFVKYVLARDGQEIVIKDGYGPLPAKVIDKQTAKLD